MEANMNSAYYYRSNKSYMNANATDGKTCRIHVPKRREESVREEFGSMNIDTVLEHVCSEKVLGCAKAVFATLALAGAVATVRGARLGAATLVSSCVCLTLVMFLEYLTNGEN